MVEIEGIHAIELGKRTVLINTHEDICLSVNTDYYKAVDLQVPDNEITKAFQRQSLMKKGLKDRINTFYIFITNRCNLSCGFCAMRSDRKESYLFSELSLDQMIHKVIPFIKQANPRKIVISGGEPFIHNAVLDFIDYISNNLDTQILIQSNGLLLNKDIIAGIKGKVTQIEISTAHFNHRENLVKLISILTTAKIKVILSFVYENNDEALMTVIDLCAVYDIDLLVNFIAPTGSALDNNLKLMDSEEKLDLFVKIAKYILKKGYADTKLAELFSKPLRVQKSCGAYGNVFVIYPDGNIYLCHSLANAELCVGNINEDISKIIDNWKNLLKQRKVKEIFHIDFKADCEDCKFKYLCGGGCGADRYHGAKLDCLFQKVILVYNLLYFNGKAENSDNLKTFIRVCENKEYLPFISDEK